MGNDRPHRLRYDLWGGAGRATFPPLVIASSNEDAITLTQHQSPGKSPASPPHFTAMGRTLHDYAEQFQPLPSGNTPCAMWALRGHLRGPEDARGTQSHG